MDWIVERQAVGSRPFWVLEADESREGKDDIGHKCSENGGRRIIE